MKTVGSAPLDTYRCEAPDHRGGRIDMHRLQVWRAADKLAIPATGLFEKHGKNTADL
jgi:hypothetical protein